MKKMLRGFLLVLAIACVEILTPAETFSQATEPINNDYWIVVPANYPAGVMLSMVSPANTRVRIKAGANTYNYTVTSAGFTHPVALPAISQHKTVVGKGIHVYSLDSLPFSASVAMGPEEFYEGALCLPTNSLGKCYRIASYQSIDSVESGNIVTLAPEFGIVATDDSTTVKIEFPTRLALAPITVRLNKGEAYHVDCGRADVKADPTGTRVSGDKPIAVYAGHQRAVIPVNKLTVTVDGMANPLIEAMPAVEGWGKIHMTVAAPSRAEDSYRLIADQDATDIYIDNGAAPVATVNAGDYFETVLSGAHEIYSTKPIMVAQYIQSGPAYYTVGGPSFLIMPPVDRFFSSSQFYFNTPGTLGTPLMVVIAPQAYAGNVQYDGVAIGAGNFVAMPQSANNPVQYAFAVINNPPMGVHTLEYSPMPASNQYSLYGYLIGEDGDRDETLFESVGFRGIRFPILSVQKSLDFGTLTCDTEKTLTIPVKNAGSAPLVIDSLYITGVNAGDYSFVPPITGRDTIAMQGLKTYTIRFRPQALGNRTARVAIVRKECDCLAGNQFNAITTYVDLLGRKDKISIASTPATVDYGNVTCKTVIDTTITVENTGTASATVTDTSFSVNNGAFKILPPTTLPFTLAAGASKSVKVRFFGTAVPTGTPFTSTLTVKASPCSVLTAVTFTAMRPPLTYTMTPSPIDLGTIAVGSSAPGVAQFENKSVLGVKITSAQFENPSSFPGVITTTFPSTVAASGTLGINFTATPYADSLYTASLCVTIDSPCTDHICIPVTIQGALPLTYPVADSLNGNFPGDVADVPIFMSKTTRVKNSDTIYVTVSYPADLLRPAGALTSVIGTISGYNDDGANGIISFALKPSSTLSTPDVKLATMPMMALLSNHRDGVIKVLTSTVRQQGRTIPSAVKDSPFSLDESCVKLEYLQKRSGVVITGIYPNPSTSEATLRAEATTDASARIDIIDVFGRIVATRETTLSKGVQEIKISVKDFSSGMYFLRLVTARSTSAATFNVAR